jgi:hypothetical protein
MAMTVAHLSLQEQPNSLSSSYHLSCNPTYPSILILFFDLIHSRRALEERYADARESTSVRAH